MSDISRSKKPLDPKSDNPSRNSATHAATSNQSNVTPEDYPAEERQQQAALVGKKGPADRKTR